MLPDGIGVIYGAKILGTPLRAKLPGIDFASALMAQMGQEGKSVFLLGAKPGVADAAAEKMRERFPGLVIAGTNDGYFQDDDPVVEKINAAQPDLLLVCLGAPKQELWMQRNAPRLRVGLMAGLGGSLDVFAGNVKRAPKLFQKPDSSGFTGSSKSQRIGRMMKLPKFLFAAIGCKLRGRNTMAKGKLIVLEGIDGSGKSAQYRRLCARFDEMGMAYHHIVFPRYDQESSALIRMYLNGAFGAHPSDVNAYAASTFFAVDRYASYRTDWGEIYENGGLILSDRYTTSNAIHQGSNCRRRSCRPSLTGCTIWSTARWACRARIWCSIWTWTCRPRSSGCSTGRKSRIPRPIFMSRTCPIWKTACASAASLPRTMAGRSCRL